MLWKKKTAEQASSVSAGEAEIAGPLDGVRVENGSFVFEGNHFEEIREGGRLSVDQLKELYPPERFHQNLIRVLGFGGKIGGYNSLQVDPSDEAFRAACEETYRLLADSPAGVVVQWISAKGLDSVFIIAIGFTPVLRDVRDEWRQKRAARIQAARKQAQPATVKTSDAGSEKGKSDE